MKEKTLRITFVVLLLLYTTIGGISVRTVSGSGLPVISMDPPTSTAAPGETFTVDIIVAGITENDSLYGWEAKISFNSTIVNVTSVIRGPFLRDAVKPESYTTLFREAINNTIGDIDVGESVWPKMPPDDKYPPVGATGNGTLATITFQVKAEGATLLHFEEGRHKLFTVISGATLDEINHEAIDGFFKYPVVHDVAVTNVTVSPAQVIKPEPIFINVTVANEGDLSETFNITAYYNSNPINITEVTLPAGANTTLEFTWNTTSITGGTYTIKAEASIVPGETDIADNTYIDDEVTVLEPPVAAFTYSPEVLVGQLMTFNSTSYDSDGEIVSYFWNFGDGTNATTENVTHTYTEAQTYTVTLNVTDNDDLFDTASEVITVATLPSTINITASPSTIKPGQTITITGSINPIKIGVNITIWYRPGGIPTWTALTTVLTNETSQYSYDWTPTTLGTYELKSSWEGDATTSGAESSPIPVEINLQPPIAVFTVEPEEPPLVGETVTFAASSSRDDDGEIVSYFWNFGDGNTTTVNNPVITHVYTATDTYSVTLTVTDDDNLTDIATDDVIVLAHDIAIISVVPFPTTVKTSESVSISVTVTNEGNFTETFNVTVYYANNSIETQTDITLISGNLTTLTFNWNTVDVAIGDYTIKAVANLVENETDPDDNTYTDGTVAIEKQSSQITISVNPSPITVGENTTISGTITPSRTGVTVTIQYRPTEGDWSILETVTTDTNGQYSYNWSPETAGTYEVKASWEGDATHLGAENNVDFVTIREATVLNIYLYAVAGIAIVIAVAIALYFLRARK